MGLPFEVQRCLFGLKICSYNFIAPIDRNEKKPERGSFDKLDMMIFGSIRFRPRRNSAFQPPDCFVNHCRSPVLSEPAGADLLLEARPVFRDVFANGFFLRGPRVDQALRAPMQFRHRVFFRYARRKFSERGCVFIFRHVVRLSYPLVSVNLLRQIIFHRVKNRAASKRGSLACGNHRDKFRVLFRGQHNADSVVSRPSRARAFGNLYVTGPSCERVLLVRCVHSVIVLFKSRSFLS
jgi:hypothetical protein